MYPQMVTWKQLGDCGCRLVTAVTLAGGHINVSSINELAADIACTRMQARTAISKLLRAGVIEVSARRNAGTEIRLANMKQNEAEKPSMEKQVKQPRKAEQVKKEEERPSDYWQKLSEKFAPVLFDNSVTWDNALKRKWLRLVGEHGEDVADLLVKSVKSSAWINEKGNLNLMLLVSNADKIIAGMYGKVFDRKDNINLYNIKRSKAALCSGGDGSFDKYKQLFKDK